MTPTFETLVDRFDIDNVQEFLGPQVVAILSLTQNFNYEADFNSFIKANFTLEECLQNEARRALLIDRFTEPELNELFAIENSSNPWERAKEHLKKSKYKNSWLTALGIEPNNPNNQSEEKEIVVGGTFGLRDYQKSVVNSLHEALIQENMPRLLLHMPTGSGKTRIAMNFCVNLLRTNRIKKILWLASMNELIDQAYDSAKEHWHKLGDSTLTITKDTDSIGSNTPVLCVTTIQGVWALLQQNIAEFINQLGTIDLLIFDEAHQITAPTYRQLVSTLSTIADSKILGLSATPGLTYNDPERDRILARFFNKKKITIPPTLTGHNPIEYLVKNEYLARAHFEQIEYANQYKIERLTNTNLIGQEFELTTAELKRLSKDDKRNIVIVNKIKQLTSVHSRIIVFAMTVQHAEVLALACQAFNINSHSVHSKTAPPKRKDLIDRFKTNSTEPMVLVNYGVLTTGFDAPNSNCVFITRPTDSLVLFSQMVGRAIRGPKSGGSETAKIVTVNDLSLPAFGNVQDAFLNWEDIWE